MAFPETFEDKSITPEALKLIIDNKDDVLIIDVRRKNDFDKEPDLIPGAIWHNPDEIDELSERIPLNQKVVIYCVKGGSVSQSVMSHLINNGIDVKNLKGGFLAWKDSGSPLVPAFG